jgi:hypothetical protein
VELKEKVWYVRDIDWVETDRLEPFQDIRDLDVMCRIYHKAKRIWTWVPTEELGYSSPHSSKRLLELLCNPEVSCVAAERIEEYDLLDLANVMPFLISKIIPRGSTLHVFGQQNVRVVIELDKSHIYPLVSRETEGFADRLFKNWEDHIGIGSIGLFFIPMIVVEGIAVSTASRSDVVMHGVLIKVAIDWDLGVACQDIVLNIRFLVVSVAYL